MEAKNKNRFIGARFTEEEKEDLELHCKKRGITLTDLIREAVFSHKRFVENFKDKEFENAYLLLKIKEDKANIVCLKSL